VERVRRRPARPDLVARPGQGSPDCSLFAILQPHGSDRPAITIPIRGRRAGQVGSAHIYAEGMRRSRQVPVRRITRVVGNSHLGAPVSSACPRRPGCCKPYMSRSCGSNGARPGAKRKGPP
jgi:hypothetical protein